jgi:hypothetical protein
MATSVWRSSQVSAQTNSNWKLFNDEVLTETRWWQHNPSELWGWPISGRGPYLTSLLLYLISQSLLYYVSVKNEEYRILCRHIHTVALLWYCSLRDFLCWVQRLQHVCAVTRYFCQVHVVVFSESDSFLTCVASWLGPSRSSSALPSYLTTRKCFKQFM